MVIALHTNEGTADPTPFTASRMPLKKEQRSPEVSVFRVQRSAPENLEQIGTNEIQGSIFGDVMTSQLAADLDPTVTRSSSPASMTFLLCLGAIDVGEKINQACIENGNLRVLGVGRRGTLSPREQAHHHSRRVQGAQAPVSPPSPTGSPFGRRLRSPHSHCFQRSIHLPADRRCRCL